MRRSRLETLLHDYVAGDLDATQRAEVEARLERDPATRALCDEIRTAHEALQCLRQRPEPPVSADDAFPRIRAALASGQFAEKPLLHLEGEGTRFYRRVAMAATLLFAVSVGVFAVNRLDRSESPGGVEAPGKTGLDADARPTAAERGLERLVELGHRPDGIDALEYMRRLREFGVRPGDAIVAPMYNAVPVSDTDIVDDR
jgi:hypothetical protein